MRKEKYPALFAPTNGYVFVVTYGRSGSTLTQSLLNAIPGYSIRGENGNLTYFLSRAIHMVTEHDMYKWRREDIKKDPDERRSYLRKILGQPYDPWAGSENVDPEDFSMSLMNVFVEQVLQPERDCRVSGFKEIRLHEDPEFFESHLNYLRDIFPNARFLFQTRDHKAVSKSSWWAKQPSDLVFQQLAIAEKLFSDYSQENSDICFTINYENFSRGHSYAKEIFDFLGEDFEPTHVDSVLHRKLKH